LIEGSPRVSNFGEPTWHRTNGEVFGGDVAQLLPGQRRRDHCCRRWPDGVGRGDGPIPSHLIEIHENAGAALLLPPAHRDVVRHPTGELAAECDYRMRGFDKAVRGLNGHEHVNPSTPTGLGESD